ncbi:Flp pilus assembly protein CpaB [Motilibacter rhizosphaerae]|uniref:Flp pilus assembly protein CpaB n=1 Tax=Motilibacter rhizosphaerae TaxID=598652 RepID=A0A4Q7NT09_9ACTN|nr:SAF domain-containing protein [Motilibacter rhizosphaerae]RZS90124.1 Flp pilus assembly protein CpaB [Motilibacter rhizosphaerae]
MPDAPAPSAARLPRARWLEPRAVLGLLLVLGSVALGSRVVASADDRTPVWALRRDLAAGARLSPADLVAVRVRLDGASGRYLAAGQAPSGLVLVRPVTAGELLPSRAVARTGGGEVRDVTLEVGAVDGIDRHAVVDVYVVPRDEPAPSSSAPSESAPSGPVLRRVPVVRTGSGSGFGSSASTTVTVEVPEAQVAPLLAAVATGSVHLVEVPAAPAVAAS